LYGGADRQEAVVTALRQHGSGPTGRERLTRVVATALVAYVFYLALGDPTDSFDLATGAVSAVVVGIVLGDVTFAGTPSRGTIRTVVRSAAFVPVLLVAVVRANLALARVILDPRLPIEPTVVRIPAPDGAFERALLANSVTLTPGTLTIDVVDGELVVHALTAERRRDLLEGSLVRAVAHTAGSEPTARVESERRR
jgi:multicomponent Na+:H+ antiporter subunit E